MSMTNLRQLVEFKGAVQSVPKFASENPRNCFRKSSHAFLSIQEKHVNKTIIREEISYIIENEKRLII